MPRIKSAMSTRSHSFSLPRAIVVLPAMTLFLSVVAPQARAQQSQAKLVRVEPDLALAPISPVQLPVQTLQAAQTIQTVLNIPGAKAALAAEPLSLRGVPRPAAGPSAPVAQSAFPTTTVGTPAASTITFTSTFSASTTITGSGVYTQGATGSDFQDVGTGTCDTNGYPYTYAASASCTAIISFTPSRPGQRLGAELLYTSTAGSYYYGYVSGIGTGPQVTFALPTPTVNTVASGLSAFDTAFDGSGDLWVTDSAAGAVKEFVPSGGVYPSTPTNIFTGFTKPQGIAIDGIGNVYVADGGVGYIWRLGAVNGVVAPGTAPVAYVTFLTASTTQPFYVAIDPTETTLYFIGIYSGSKEMVSCTISSGSCALITTFTAPSSLAIDSAGYKYILDSSTKIVYRIPASATSTTKTTVVSGLTLPYGLTTDAAGDLYVVDQAAGTSGAGSVIEYLATAGLVSTASAKRTLVSGLYAPNGVAVDSTGNLFIADTSNTAVKYVDLTDPPKVPFGTTTVGSTSGTQTVTLQNIGNANLTFPVPTTGTNPSVPAGFTLSNTSTCPQLTTGSATAGTLAEGVTCTYLPAYQPVQTGPLVGYLTVTDNNLAVTSSQIIRLTGSTSAVPVITVTAVIASAASPAVTLSFIVGYGGGATPSGTPTVQVNGSTTGVGSSTCSSKLGHTNCQLTYNASSLAAGNYTIVVTQPADGNYTATTGSGTLTLQ